MTGCTSSSVSHLSFKFRGTTTHLTQSSGVVVDGVAFKVGLYGLRKWKVFNAIDSGRSHNGTATQLL